MSNLGIQEIQDQYLIDVTWTPETINEYLVKIPLLVAKYQGYWFSYKNMYDKKQKDYDNSYFSKYSYYKAGESDLALSATEIKQFVEKDTSVVAVQLEMRNLLSNCELLEKMMKNIDSIRWDLKNYITYQQFINGIL